MTADRPLDLYDSRGAPAFRISRGDTVKLAILREPDTHYHASVFLEVWEPGGSQPPNSHPDSVETFFFLSGEGRAFCDEAEIEVSAGQLLVLPERSLHRIVNTGAKKLVAITTMSPDRGFADLVRSGEPAELEPEVLDLCSASA